MLKRLRIKFVAVIMIIVTAMLCLIFGMVYFFTKNNMEAESINMMQIVASRPLQPGRPDRPSNEVWLPHFVLQIGRGGEIITAGGEYYDLSDEEFLRALTDAVFAQGGQTGVIEEYDLRFFRVETPMGQSLVFADMSNELKTLSSLAKTCVFINTVSTVDQMLGETAVLAAERISQELAAYKNVAMDTGYIPQLSDPSVPVAEKRAVIDERVSMHGFQRGNIVGLDGISIFDGNDYSSREYVQQAMKGNVYVSEPLISKITGELSIMVAAPIYSGGSRDGRIAGVVYFVPPETFLNDIVSSIRSARTVGPT